MGIMTPTSVIELMPSTNDQIELFSNYIKLSILNSETDFRKFLYQKKLIEKTFDAISESPEIKEFIENEIEKYGKEGVSFNDLKFELKGRKTWNYDNTGDSELKELERQKAELDAKIKNRQKLLQTASKPFADIDTGEIIHPAFYTEKTFVKSTQVKTK